MGPYFLSSPAIVIFYARSRLGFCYTFDMPKSIVSLCGTMSFRGVFDLNPREHYKRVVRLSCANIYRERLILLT